MERIKIHVSRGLLSNKNKIRMPKQLFSKNPKPRDLDALQNIWPIRTFEIYDKKVSFVICGEIDAFNKSGKVKYNRSLPFEILINPTHYNQR